MRLFILILLTLSLHAKELNLSPYIDSFKGIEYYFLKITEDKYETSLAKIAMLKKYHKIPLDKNLQHAMSEFEEIQFSYTVVTLDKRAGYMKLTCNNCENTKIMTYWNAPKKSKVIATVDRSCGPICSDDFNLYSYKKGKLSSIQTPIIRELDFLNDIKDRKIIEEDAWEMEYRLPRKGKDITVVLGEFKKNSIFKGNTTHLIYNAGEFTKGSFFYK